MLLKILKEYANKQGYTILWQTGNKNFDEVIQVVKKIDEDEELFKKYLREPIGTDAQFPEYALKEYREYIVSICKQTPESALRRNNVFWGAKYQKTMKELRFPQKTSITKRVYRKIKKIFMY